MGLLDYLQNEVKENEEIQIVTIPVDDSPITAEVTAAIPNETGVQPYDNRRTIDVKITDSTILDSLRSETKVFKSEWTVKTNAVTTDTTQFNYNGEKWGFSTSFSIESDDMNWVSDFNRVVTSYSSMIPSGDALQSMGVRISLNDDLRPFDYTIYFSTTEPHEYWGDCETLEEYCKMVAEQNDGVTMQEMMNQDEYMSHTHLMGDSTSVDEWMDEFVRSVVDTHFEVEDAVTVHPTLLNTSFEDTFTLEGVVTKT